MLVALAAGGCRGPLDRSDEEAMRDALLQSHRLRLEQLAPGQVLELERTPSDVEARMTPERLRELDEISGPETYRDEPLELDRDFLGDEESPVVRLTLEEAVRIAVEHNLDLETARLTPAIARTQITQAEAAFDATFFTTAQWSQQHTFRPEQQDFFGGTTGGVQDVDTRELTTGVRQPLTTGAEATATTTVRRQDGDVTGVEGSFYETDVMLSLTQPLLRNFGAPARQAEIRLARAARAEQREQVVQTLLDVAFAVEQVYWELLLAQHQLRVRTRLLERTIAERDRLEERLAFDVSPVRITEANSFVEQRRADVIRARQQVRTTSDQLKQLINAPDLPVADETLIVPVAEPADAPLHFSLRDAVRRAMRHRPDLQQALLGIHNASVRQEVADSDRLAQLDLEAAINFRGFDEDSAGRALSQLDRFNFIDFVLGARFEYPLGNRQRRARLQQRRIERQQAVLEYQRTAQSAVLQVKNALREVATAYELIGATRAARRAAARNLAAIEEQEEAGIALTPEFLLDLKLRAQQRLADTEIEEMQARTQYIVAIAELYRQMGTLLQRNRIDLADPIE